MHSFASTAEGSCALIKLTSKYPCRHLQNTQKLLKCSWDGNLLCMYAAVLINSLFRLQPRLALQPAEHISSVPLSHRGHYSNSLTHESLLWLNQSSEVTPAAGAGLCELLTTDCLLETSVWIKRFSTIQRYQSWENKAQEMKRHSIQNTVKRKCGAHEASTHFLDVLWGGIFVKCEKINTLRLNKADLYWGILLTEK